MSTIALENPGQKIWKSAFFFAIALAILFAALAARTFMGASGPAVPLKRCLSCPSCVCPKDLSGSTGCPCPK